MYILNLLFSLLLTSNFPLYFIYELFGIKNIYLLIYASLNILILFLRKNILIKLNKIDIIFSLFLFYLLIYFSINNNDLLSLYNLKFYFLVIRNIFLPYITGRIIYRFLNKTLFKNMAYLFCSYLFILILVLILKPDSFLESRFTIFGSNSRNNDLTQIFLSDGIGFFIITFISLLKDNKFLQKIKSNNINKKIIYLFSFLIFLILIFLCSRKIIMAALLIFILKFYKNILNYLKVISRSPSFIIYCISIISIIIIFFSFTVDSQNPDDKIDHLKQIGGLIEIFNYKKDFCSNMTNSISTRVSYFHDSLKIIKDNFLLGIGPGQFSKYFCEGNYLGSNAFEHPHNILLNIFSELGLIGILIITYPLKIIFNKLDQINIKNSFNINFIIYSFQFTFLIAILSGSYYIDSFYFALFTGSLVSLASDKRLFS